MDISVTQLCQERQKAKKRREKQTDEIRQKTYINQDDDYK